MDRGIRRGTSRRVVSAVAAVVIGVSVGMTGKAQRGGQPPSPARSAQAVAPLDLTGYWVSVVTEDWRWRMLTPPKGDYESVPLNAAGRKVVDAWDPDKDEAAGEQCRAYGAAGLMRIPGRLHITWENENVLKVDTDAGQQTRRLQFNVSRSVATSAGRRGWQGVSVAEWETESPLKYQIGGLASGGTTNPVPPLKLTGSLKVVTSNMRAGYLRKNGVPYSENAMLTEYFDKTDPEPNGDVWLTITSVVEDPTYLLQPFMTSTHFKHERDGSKWRPKPCEIIRPSK